MKRELLFIIGLSSAIYATQNISCVDFVNMSKAEAKSYLDNYRREFELNHFKTKNHTDVDKQYITTQGRVSKHILTCINLRKISHYDVEDVRRALILSSLSKKGLAVEESDIYHNILNENLSYYHRYTHSSIAKVGHLPLVYLTIQKSKDNIHYIIYEFRKNGAEIKRYSKKILISKPYIKEVSQGYLNYLNANTINPRLRKYAPVHNKKPKRVNVTPPYSGNRMEYEVEKKYKVIKPINASYINESLEDRSIELIMVGTILRKIKEDKNNVYFTTKWKDEYFVSKKWWDRGTKQIGGFQ